MRSKQNTGCQPATSINEKKNTMDNKDSLDDVVTKLNVVSDFMQMLDCSPYLRKCTPGTQPDH